MHERQAGAGARQALRTMPAKTQPVRIRITFSALVRKADMHATDPSLAARLTALEATRGGPSSLLPFLLGCLLTATALLLVAGAVAASWLQRQQERCRLLSAANLAAVDQSRLRQLLGEALPAW